MVVPQDEYLTIRGEGKILKAIKKIIRYIFATAFIFFIFCYATSLTGSAGGSGGTGQEYMLRIPKMGYLIEYAGTRTGSILCIAMPGAILAYNVTVMIADLMHDSGKHRKMIMRSRKRRRDRYIKEGLYV